MRQFTSIVVTRQPKRAFETSFDVMWYVLHHVTDESVCGMVDCSMATAECAGDTFGFVWTI